MSRLTPHITPSDAPERARGRRGLPLNDRAGQVQSRGAGLNVQGAFTEQLAGEPPVATTNGWGTPWWKYQRQP